MIGALVAGITGLGGASLSSYESIATATGTGSSGTITFSSIPSGFKHLQIRGIGRTTTASTVNALLMQFNADTGTNYAGHYLEGDGSTVSATGWASDTYMLPGYLPGTSISANIHGVFVADILDFNSSTKNKTLRSFFGYDSNGAAQRININSGFRISTDAITSIRIFMNSGSFTTTTQFALYGIKEA